MGLGDSVSSESALKAEYLAGGPMFMLLHGKGKGGCLYAKLAALSLFCQGLGRETCTSTPMIWWR